MFLPRYTLPRRTRIKTRELLGSAPAPMTAISKVFKWEGLAKDFSFKALAIGLSNAYESLPRTSRSPSSGSLRSPLSASSPAPSSLTAHRDHQIYPPFPRKVFPLAFLAFREWPVFFL